MMNWKEYEKKLSWHFLRATEYNHEKPENIQCPNRASSRTPPRYKSKALPPELTYQWHRVQYSNVCVRFTDEAIQVNHIYVPVHGKKVKLSLCLSN
jgi:hypothetical protein